MANTRNTPPPEEEQQYNDTLYDLRQEEGRHQEEQESFRRTVQGLEEEHVNIARRTRALQEQSEEIQNAARKGQISEADARREYRARQREIERLEDERRSLRRKEEEARENARRIDARKKEEFERRKTEALRKRESERTAREAREYEARQNKNTSSQNRTAPQTPDDQQGKTQTPEPAGKPDQKETETTEETTPTQSNTAPEPVTASGNNESNTQDGAPTAGSNKQQESTGKKDSSSRSSKIAKGIGKAALYSTPAGMAYGAVKLARGNNEQNPQATSSNNAQSIGQDTGQSEDEKVQDLMMGRAPQPTSSTPETTASRKPSKAGQAAKTVGKGAGKFTMYTSPGAFVVGKFLGRKKERDEAKREIEQIQQNAQERPSKKPRKANFFTKSSKRIGDIVAKTTGAYWINKYLLKGSKRKKNADETSQSSDEIATGSHNDKRHYQNWWNKKILEKTASQRQFIKQQLSKFFKSRAWKYGKYALSPGGALAYDMYKKRQAQQQPKKNEEWYMSHYNNPRDKSGSSRQHTSPKNPISQRMQRFTKSSGKAIYKYTTPTGQIQAGWNRWGKSRMPSLNSRLGRQFGNVPSPRQMGRRAASKIGDQIGKKLVKQAVLTFLRTPPGWVTVGVIAAVFLFFGFMMVITSVLFGGGGGGGGTQVGGGTPGGSLPGAGTNPIPGFTLSKSVSETEIPGPEEITYTISFSNSGTLPLEQITIYDQLPQNTTLVTNKTTGDFQIEGPIISWNLSSPSNTSPLTLTILPITTDMLISNQAYALATQVASGGGQAPTTANCNGAYTLDNPIGNFGDPDCYFAENNAQAKSDLYELLRTQDPANADGWFLKVIPCESSYNPNAYLAASASGLGAYGLYQMNPDGRGNNEYDSGSVPWRTQTSNALTYGKMLTANGISLGAYWHCWQ